MLWGAWYLLPAAVDTSGGRAKGVCVVSGDGSYFYVYSTAENGTRYIFIEVTENASGLVGVSSCPVARPVPASFSLAFLKFFFFPLLLVFSRRLRTSSRYDERTPAVFSPFSLQHPRHRKSTAVPKRIVSTWYIFTFRTVERICDIFLHAV